VNACFTVRFTVWVRHLRFMAILGVMLGLGTGKD
jgi:hypothetical protein